jgi:hypothetical protein
MVLQLPQRIFNLSYRTYENVAMQKLIQAQTPNRERQTGSLLPAALIPP